MPAYLKIGDTIGIVSTASKINAEVIKPAVDLLEALGYKVKIAPHVFAQHHQFAGTDEQRASDLQTMIDDDTVKAIVCSRGGYGTLRTIQTVNWSKFRQKPKWLVGFSDVTVLHSLLNQFNIASAHGVMPRYFVDEGQATSSFAYLHQVLKGEGLRYQIEAHSMNRHGFAEAEMVGGNLSILYNLRGTSYDLNTKGKILFIEDLGEYLYHLDRIMMNLWVGGKLSNLAGLVVGGFSAMKDHENKFGMSVEEIIMDAVKNFDYPVMFNFPAGHQKENYPLVFGQIATFQVEKNKVVLVQ